MHSDSQKVTVNLILDGIARKPLIGELRSKRQCRKVLFISANTLGVEGTNLNNRNRGSNTTILLLLMLKHDHAYLSVDSEESTL